MMVHRSWTKGKAPDTILADIENSKFDERLAKEFAARTDCEADTARELCRREKYFDAETALARGVVGRVLDVERERQEAERLKQEFERARSRDIEVAREKLERQMAMLPSWHAEDKRLIDAALAARQKKAADSWGSPPKRHVPTNDYAVNADGLIFFDGVKQPRELPKTKAGETATEWARRNFERWRRRLPIER